MKTVKTNSNDIIVVEFAKEKEVEVIANYNTGELFLNKGLIGQFGLNDNLSILGKLSELEDNNLDRFVEKFTMDRHDGNFIEFENYVDKIDTCKTPKQSFISLLQSNGIETENKELLIIEVL